MANINVNDLEGLNPSGADLFDDPESFMVELSEEGNESILGGCPGNGCPGRSIVCTAICSLRVSYLEP